MAVYLRALVAAVLLLVGAGAACGDGGAKSASPGSSTSVKGRTATATPSGFRRVVDEANGFSISVPSDWQSVVITPETAKAGADLVRSLNPALGDATVLPRPIKLVTASPKKASLMVQRMDYPKSAKPSTLKEIAEAISESPHTSGAFSQAYETLPAGPALKTTSDVPLGAQRMTSTIYTLVHGHAQFTLSLASLAPAETKSAFAEIVQSFRLLGD